MSDHDDGRPSKRRRRDSSPPPPPSKPHKEERYRDRHRGDGFSQNARYPEKRRSEQVYESTSRSHRYSISPRRDRDEGHNRNHEQGTRSRESHRDRSDRSHRDRDTYGPSQSDRHGYKERDQDQGRERKDRRRDEDRSSRRSASPKPYERSKAPLPSQSDAYTATKDPSSVIEKPLEKQKANFGLTGKLAAASNTVQTANQTIVLKYHEPPEARKPPGKDKWRLYVFKGEEILDTVELSEQSCWLIGREVAVADFPLEHSSCSKQHATIQFRYVEKRNEFGDKIGKVKPYVIDLESANGTSLNENPIPPAKYVELRDKDVLKFGHSSREYVVQLPPSAGEKKN